MRQLPVARCTIDSLNVHRVRCEEAKRLVEHDGVVAAACHSGVTAATLLQRHRSLLQQERERRNDSA